MGTICINFETGLKPLNPSIYHAYSPHCSPYILYGNDEENLLNNQDRCYLLITSFLSDVSEINHGLWK